MHRFGHMFPIAVFCLLTAAAAGEKKMYDILDYGAKGDGKALCTQAIQKAVDACAAGGGGTVRFPPGTFRSGAVRMNSRVTLLLEKGATLLGSRELKDYYGPRIDPNGRAVPQSSIFRNLIHGEGLHDVAIRGAGTIDGSGSAFRDKTKPRAKCIYLVNCRNVLVESVRLRSAGSWMQHYRLCEKLAIRNIDVFNHVVDITVERCKVFSPKHSKKIYGRQRGLAGIALEIVDGGRMENVSVTDVDIEGVSVPIFLRLGNRGRLYGREKKPPVGTFRNVRLKDITARGTSRIGCSITGLPGHPIQDVTLTNVRLGFEGGAARQVHLPGQLPQRARRVRPPAKRRLLDAALPPLRKAGHPQHRRLQPRSPTSSSSCSTTRASATSAATGRRRSRPP